MAPALRWDLWSNVLRWSLAHTHTGWGLDWTMPFILGYPKNRVAIVDAVRRLPQQRAPLRCRPAPGLEACPQADASLPAAAAASLL